MDENSARNRRRRPHSTSSDYRSFIAKMPAHIQVSGDAEARERTNSARLIYELCAALTSASRRCNFFNKMFLSEAFIDLQLLDSLLVRPQARHQHSVPQTEAIKDGNLQTHS